MALAPTLIRSSEDHGPNLSSSVAWWSPATLNINALSLPAGADTSGPILFAAGLNSFMMVIHLTVAVTTQTFLSLYQPSDQAAMVLDFADDAAPAALDQARTFGAFSLNFLTGTFLTSDIVWWLFSMRFRNSGAVATTATVHLFGARR